MAWLLRGYQVGGCLDFTAADGTETRLRHPKGFGFDNLSISVKISRQTCQIIGTVASRRVRYIVSWQGAWKHTWRSCTEYEN